MNFAALLFASKASDHVTHNIVGGIVLMVLLTLLLGGLFLASVMAYLPTEVVPARLRRFQKLTQRFFEGDADAIARDNASGEAGERAMLYQQLQLIHPEADPGTLAVMAEQMRRSAERQAKAAEQPAPVQPQLKPAPLQASDVTLFATEIDLHLGIALAIQEDHTVRVTRRQYKTLTQYCAFRFEQVETPEFTFGRFGLLLLVEN